MSEVATKVYASNLQAFIEKAHRDLHGKKLDASQKYIELIICALQQFMRGDSKKMLLNLPGRHLKTFICSVALPAFLLGRNPALKFMIVAYNEEVAVEIVRQIREIMESSWYKKDFSEPNC